MAELGCVRGACAVVAIVALLAALAAMMALAVLGWYRRWLLSLTCAVELCVVELCAGEFCAAELGGADCVLRTSGVVIALLRVLVAALGA